MNYFSRKKKHLLQAYLHNPFKVTPKSIFLAKRYFLFTQKKNDRIIFLWKQGIELHVFFLRKHNLDTKPKEGVDMFCFMILNSRTCCILLQYKGKGKGFTEVESKQISRPSKQFQKQKTKRIQTIEEEAVEERIIIRSDFFHASPQIDVKHRT